MRARPQGLWQAIWIITVADITMSTDNILAVAGVSKGNVFLLIFGLGLSIPFVVFTSELLSRLMDQYPFVILVGAAILGRVGGDMIITDPLIARIFHPSEILEYTVQALCALGVIAAGSLLMRFKKSPEAQTVLNDSDSKRNDSEKRRGID